MRRMLLALLALAWPIAAFASSVNFTNRVGNLIGTHAIVTGSNLNAVDSLDAVGLTTVYNQGRGSFRIGARTSRDFQSNAVFGSRVPAQLGLSFSSNIRWFRAVGRHLCRTEVTPVT